MKSATHAKPKAKTHSSASTKVKRVSAGSTPAQMRKTQSIQLSAIGNGNGLLRDSPIHLRNGGSALTTIQPIDAAFVRADATIILPKINLQRWMHP